MSKEVIKQIHFYTHYQKPSQTVCPLMVGKGYKNESVTFCDCEPLREAVADKCGLDEKCPVREESFGESAK